VSALTLNATRGEARSPRHTWPLSFCHRLSLLACVDRRWRCASFAISGAGSRGADRQAGLVDRQTPASVGPGKLTIGHMFVVRCFGNHKRKPSVFVFEQQARGFYERRDAKISFKHFAGQKLHQGGAGMRG
jgi:hypothetical protein